MRKLIAIAALAVLSSFAATIEKGTGGRNRAVIDPTFDCVLPHIITGGGFKTSIVIVNLGTTEAKIELFFIDFDANDQPHPWVGVGLANWLVVKIPGRGSFTIQSEDSSRSREGWGLLVQNGVGTGGTYGKVAAHTVTEFEGRETITPVTTMGEKRALIPVDNTSSITTTVCVVNFDPKTKGVRFRGYATDGKFIGEMTVAIRSFGRLCLDTTKLPELETGRAVIDITTEGDFMAVFGLRANPNGAGGVTAFTSFSLKDWLY